MVTAETILLEYMSTDEFKKEAVTVVITALVVDYSTK
jgi:hypothetical protein